MALADGVVVEVVRRGDLDAAGAELAVDIVVGDDRDVAAGERQLDGLADQVGVALVFGMHHHRDVAEQCLGAGGGDGQAFQVTDRAVGERIQDVVELAVLFLGHHLEVGHRGAELGVPVHQALAAVDQALVVEAHEGLGDGLRQALVHREALALPVRAGAEAPHLAGDGAAGVFLPLPHLFQELLAAEVVAADALRVQLAFDDDLGGDAGVVGARLPQRVVAAHAVVARERVHERLVEAVPHVQRAGDVGRRQQDAEGGGVRRVEPGVEVAAGFPFRVPATFDVGGLEALGQFHGVFSA